MYQVARKKPHTQKHILFHFQQYILPYIACRMMSDSMGIICLWMPVFIVGNYVCVFYWKAFNPPSQTKARQCRDFQLNGRFLPYSFLPEHIAGCRGREVRNSGVDLSVVNYKQQQYLGRLSSRIVHVPRTGWPDLVKSCEQRWHKTPFISFLTGTLSLM
jgi:hypothetical protein